MKLCPQCRYQNKNNTHFCTNCGKQLPVVKSIFKDKTAMIIIGGLIGTVLLVVILAAIVDTVKPKKAELVSNDIFTEADKKRDENLQKAKSALGENYDEKNNKFGNIEEAEKLVSEIRQYDKQYKEAQEIVKEINRRKELIAAIPKTNSIVQENQPGDQIKTLKSAPVVDDKINNSGASAKCRDGSLSYSEHRRGACSRHGGVAVWY